MTQQRARETASSNGSGVAVLGLGAMGAALARAFVATGRPTTVWNRTAAKAEPLAALGATVAATAEQAAAADVTVVCVLDSVAVEDLLPRIAAGNPGTVVVNLTSATPEQSRDLAGRAAALGLAYLDGAIMVPTPLIGTADAYVIYSGDPALFDRHRGTLLGIGGEAEHLGADPGLAALYDLGMLDVFFAGMTSFLHASAMVGADGVSAKAFLPYADRVLEVLRGSIAGLAEAVDADAHPGDEDNLEMDLAALAHVVATSDSRGVDPVVPLLSHDLTRAAIEAGHGRDGYSRLVTVLRR